MILLQATEVTGFFDAMMQQGIAFGLMALIIYVLGRRVVKLENDNKDLINSQIDAIKEHTIILKEATEAIKQFNEKQ
jgi:membrane protein implicated in regulation of membrane protease activity